MPAVDICGITNTEDAKWAAIHGVEYVTIYRDPESSHSISVSRAAEIRHLLPDYSEVALDFGDSENINLKELDKISPSIVKFYMPGDYSEFEDIKKLLEEKNCEIVIKSRCSGGISTCTVAFGGFIQLELDENIQDEEIKVPEEISSGKIIILGDFPVDRIKKLCGIIQPHAWCLKNIISCSSSRRIDYNKMKKFIREISLL